MIVLAYIDPGTYQTVAGGLAALLGVILSIVGAAWLFLRRFWAGAMHNRRWLGFSAIILLAAGIVFLVATVCGSKDKNVIVSSFNGRIIVLGLDGLSPEIIEPMMDSGNLPNLLRLRRQGGYRRLRTTNPAQSPVAWSGFATGRNSGKHAIHDFIRSRPASYIPELALTRFDKEQPSRSRRAKAFWEYARELQVPMTILNCPGTFPPDKIYGKMVAGMGTPDLLGTQGTFTFFTTDTAATPSEDTGGEVNVVAPTNRFRLELLGPWRQGISSKKRLSVPFEVVVAFDKRSAEIRLPGHSFIIKPGEWSDWEQVKFKVGLGKSMRGLAQFHLVCLDPQFKLFASPISLDPRNPWWPITYPPDYGRDLAEKIGLFGTRGMPYETWGLNENRLDDKTFLQHAGGLFQERRRLLLHELQRCRAGVIFCYFDYPDIIQHMYWPADDHLRTADQPMEQLDACYRLMDMLVGETLDNLRPNDTLFVLSDHGFSAFRRAAHVNSWLRENGYLTLHPPNAPSGRPLLADVDWSRTMAYALGFTGIYINRRDREPAGIVKSGDIDALKREIQRKLETWTDPDTQEPILRKAYRSEEIIAGPESGSAPDIFLGMNRGYRTSWQTALGAVPPMLIETNQKHWRGDHMVDPALVPGILFSTRPIDAPSPSILDLTPTILKLIGMSSERIAKEGFDGQPLY